MGSLWAMDGSTNGTISVGSFSFFPFIFHFSFFFSFPFLTIHFGRNSLACFQIHFASPFLLSPTTHACYLALQPSKVGSYTTRTGTASSKPHCSETNLLNQLFYETQDTRNRVAFYHSALVEIYIACLGTFYFAAEASNDAGKSKDNPVYWQQ